MGSIPIVSTEALKRLATIVKYPRVALAELRGFSWRTDQFPKPFWQAARNAWFVQVNGKQVKLSADKDEAFRRYHELMSRPPEAVASQPAPASGELVVQLVDDLLEWAKCNRAKATYDV